MAYDPYFCCFLSASLSFFLASASRIFFWKYASSIGCKGRSVYSKLPLCVRFFFSFWQAWLREECKSFDLSAIYDTVHEMARDEAGHGKAFEGLLARYFGWYLKVNKINTFKGVDFGLLPFFFCRFYCPNPPWLWKFIGTFCFLLWRKAQILEVTILEAFQYANYIKNPRSCERG